VRDANVGLERVENRKFGVDGVLFVVDRESRDFVLCPSSFNTKSAAKKLNKGGDVVSFEFKFGEVPCFLIS
jgi:hypothetical protein